jgi:hypothetical protein
MASGSFNRYIEALWKFILLVVVLHVIILIAASFMSNKIGLYGLKVFWAHISSGGTETILITIVLAILVYWGVYKYWTHDSLWNKTKRIMGR